AIVIVFFVITGATGLIYQIVWFKYLALFLGNTTYAQMIVLSAFLGGLAIGNYYFGKRADSFTNPLKYYAIFELTIGLYCLIYPTVSLLLGDAFIAVASNFTTDGRDLVFNSTRLIISSLLLFIPTIAMGGTLPVLSKFYIKDISQTRKDLSILYFLNSFGAVWGIIIGGFQLIKLIGLNATTYSAATVNILIGVIALVLARFAESDDAKEEIAEEKITEHTDAETISAGTIRSLILVAGISGMAALLYEMVWTRLFINIFGSSTYAFSIMLLVFISGITLGGFVISQKFFERFDKVKLVAVLQFLIGGSTMLVLTLYERLPYYLWATSSYFVKSESTFNIFLTLEFMICFLIMFVPTTMMGMSLPLIASIIAIQSKKIGLSVGKVFSVNTVGTVLGVLLTGLVFIPVFGVKGSFEIGIGINIIGAAVVIYMYEKFNVKKKLGYIVSLAGIFLLYVLFIPQWNINASLFGVFRSLNKQAPESFDQYMKSRGSFDLLYYKEGTNANVAVTESGSPKEKVLIINGKPDASSIGDMPTQILVGQIPMILHPNPENVFMVGFGSGATIGTVLRHPIEKMDCAEISSEVIEAGHFFKEENQNCMEDERLNIYNEDALTLLKLSSEKYDVIISEPSNPWIAGIGNLFSKEYFELCKSKLDSNGIMVQWYHLYESQDEVVQLVLGTFQSVFPNSQVWNGVANDIIIVGYKNEYKPDFDFLTEKLNRPELKNEMSKIGIDNLFTLLSCQSLSDEGIYILSDPYRLNSELHPLLEFIAPKSFYISQTSTLVYQYDEKFDTLGNKLFVYDYVKDYTPSFEELKNSALHHYNTSKNFRFAFGLTDYLLKNNYDDYDTKMLYTDVFNKLQIDDPRKYHYEKILDQYPDSTQLIHDYLNMKILETVNSTNFYNVNSLKSLSERYIASSSDDSLKMAKLYIQLARNYMLNSELEYAYQMC
ncbi:fused MFS/spermidine synthase, partial [Bacteroidota bacterium]